MSQSQLSEGQSLYARATALRKSGSLIEALACYDQAMKYQENEPVLFNDRGNVLLALERYDEALNSYDRALAIQANYVQALDNRGIALQSLHRLTEAVESHQKAINLMPFNANAYNNCGNAFSALKKTKEALTYYGQAINLNPNFVEAHFNKGRTLLCLHRTKEALKSFKTVFELNPNNAPVCNLIGVQLSNQGSELMVEALEYFKAATVIDSKNAEFHYNLGIIYQRQQQFNLALEAYQRALSVSPSYKFLFGRYLNMKLSLCNWKDLNEEIEMYASKIAQGKAVTTPFVASILLNRPDLQQIAAQQYSSIRFAKKMQNYFGRENQRNQLSKIRIAYYSADFHNHATAYLMAQLFELHDKSRFEVYAFSFGPDVQDDMRERLIRSFDCFYSVINKSDEQIAQLSRKLGIDIAIDLKGYTGSHRAGIFAERCAPIQINYLGYPGTMGAEFMDYIIADRTIIPPELEHHCTEKVIRLPDSYQPNDRQRAIADYTPTRAELGLPKGAFIFCCFNNNYKILPETFDSWIRILNAVEGSVLWLLQDNPIAAKNLRKEAEARGLDSKRLIFAKRAPLAEHLARHRQADLFLDTFPCNAHTTASDALWAGLPLLTRMGQSFASRVAASLLRAADLPELVTDSQDGYERMAIHLARNPDELRALKNRLMHNRDTCALFDTESYVRNLEQAYQQIMCQKGFI